MDVPTGVCMKRHQSSSASSKSIAFGILLALAACEDGPASADGSETSETDGDTSVDTDGATSGDTDGPAMDDEVVYLEPQAQLVRIAMALRGVRPTEAELDAVAEDPDALPEIVEQYLQTPEFGETMRDLHNDALLVLADYFIYPAGFPDLPPLQDADPYRMNRSITESPLRLIEHVIMNDRPYTEIVTADYAVANDYVATIWGAPYDGDGGWEVTQWSDGRPHAGILSDPWLFQRHRSTPSNANRGRANAISRALLCYDFLSRDIEIDASINLADPARVADAVVQNPACASCHQALDPLAGFFGDYIGIFVPSELPEYGVTEYPFQTYYPGYFQSEYGVTLRDPTFFGIAGESLSDLGAYLAADPRFSLCAAQRFYAYFHQVPLDEVPLEDAAQLQVAFLDSGMSAKALAKEIVLSEQFAMSHAAEGSQLDVRGVKKARPHQLANLVRDLTGYQWSTRLVYEPDDFDSGTIDLMDDAFFGYQVLFGGIDSVFVTRPSHTFSATSSLVLRAFAAQAAGAVVDADFDQADPSERRLLRLVGESDSTEPVIREQLTWLHMRVLGERVEPDSLEIDESWELFAAALDATNDTRRAWKVTLTAMLQDMKIAYY